MTTEDRIEAVAYRYWHPRDGQDFGSTPLTEADKEAGWNEEPLYRSIPLPVGGDGERMPLGDRIFVALGGLRDEMPDEDVRAVQRFAKRLNEIRLQHSVPSVGGSDE